MLYIITINMTGSVKRHSKRHSRKRSSLRHLKSHPKESAQHFSLGQKKKGRSGKMYQVVAVGKHFVWKKCKKSCKGVQSGPSPAPYGFSLGGARKSKRRSSKKSARKSKKRSARKSKKRSSKKRSSKKRSSKK